MRPVARNTLLLAVLVVVVTAGFAAGWYAHSANGGGPSTPLGIIAAGSLAPHALLPAPASEYANETPGISAPIASQLYEGSTAAATTIASPGSRSPYDIFVSADFRVIPQRLINASPSHAGGEAVYASDPIVLAYDPSALPDLNASNWPTEIMGPGIVLGVPNASADPLGANVIFVLELEDAARSHGGGLYAHFFSGSVGGFARPSANTRYVLENDAAAALTAREVSVYFLYASYARASDLSFLPLRSAVDLGGFSASDVANYGNASTTVLSGSSGATRVVTGAPALFALTVPTNAPSRSVGNAFAAWLLSAQTAREWTADGFVLTPAVWTVGTVSFLPVGGSPLPSYLASLLR